MSVIYVFRIEKHHLQAIQDISTAIKLDPGCQTLKVCGIIGYVRKCVKFMLKVQYYFEKLFIISPEVMWLNEIYLFVSKVCPCSLGID